MKTDVQEFFDAIYPIKDKNSGGCLFFCYAFFLWLKKNKLPLNDFQIKQYSREEYKIENNKGYHNGNTPVSSAHFTWIYDGKEYDSIGAATRKSFTFDKLSFYKSDILDTVTHDIVESFCIDALSINQWNDAFERIPAVDHIRKTLGLELSHVI